MENTTEVKRDFVHNFADWSGIPLLSDANLLTWGRWRPRDVTMHWGESVTEFMPRQVAFGLEVYCLVPLEGTITLGELRKRFFKRITAFADSLHYREFLGDAALHSVFNPGFNLMIEAGALTLRTNTVERSASDSEYLNELPFELYATVLAKKSTKAKTSMKRGLGLSCITTNPLREPSVNIADLSERLSGYIEYSSKDHERLHFYHGFRTEPDGTETGTGTLVNVGRDGDSICAFDQNTVYSQEPNEIRDIALHDHLRNDKRFIAAVQDSKPEQTRGFERATSPKRRRFFGARDNRETASVGGNPNSTWLDFVNAIKVVPVDLLARYCPDFYQGYVQNVMFTAGGRLDLALRGLYIYNGLVFSDLGTARLWLPKKLPYSDPGEYHFEIQSGLLDKDVKTILTALTVFRPSDYAKALEKLKDGLRDLEGKGEIQYDQDTGFVMYPLERLGYVTLNRDTNMAELIEREKVKALLSLL